VWDGVSDGQRLPESLRKAPGLQRLWSQFGSYTKNYVKKWMGATSRYDQIDAKKASKGAREMFMEAPTYISPVYRGFKIEGGYSEALQWVKDNRDTVDMRGGSSFSFSSSTAEGFANWGGASETAGRYPMLLEVRSGVTGLPVRSLSNYAGENEILVASKMKIVQVNDTPQGLHIVLEQIGEWYGS